MVNVFSGPRQKCLKSSATEDKLMINNSLTLAPKC